MRLEMILSNAQIIEEGSKDIVGLGDKVTVQEVGTDEVPKCTIMVGVAEANPRAGKISHKSPLGRALMDHHIGDRVIVEAPDGNIVFEVKAIE